MAKGEKRAKSDLEKKSKDYDSMANYWQLVNDLAGGLDAMKLKTVEYLPKLPAEDNEHYLYRLSIAKLTNVYRDIVETLSTKPFEIPVVVENTTAEIDDWLTDVDGSGNDLSTFAQTTFFNGINSALDWIFIDFVVTDQSQVMSIADAQKIGNRPYWSHVLAMNVFDVRSRIRAGKEEIYYIKIYEPGDVKHFRIMEIRDDGKAWFELWQENPSNPEEFISIDENMISIGVIPMVPFSTGRRKGKSFQYYPLLRDAADLQRFLYRKENDLDYAEVMGCFPMISASGVSPARDVGGNILPMPTGPNTILYAEVNTRDGSAGSYTYLEPAGSSYSQLSSTIKETINNIREIGKMPLTAQSTGVTVITSAIAGGKAKTTLGAAALNLENSLEMAFYYTTLYLSVNIELKAKVNREFDDIDESNEADKGRLMEMRRNRDLSQLTLWEQMMARGTLPDDFKPEEELKRLSAEMPVDDNTDSSGNTFIQ